MASLNPRGYWTTPDFPDATGLTDKELDEIMDPQEQAMFANDRVSNFIMDELYAARQQRDTMQMEAVSRSALAAENRDLKVTVDSHGKDIDELTERVQTVSRDNDRLYLELDEKQREIESLLREPSRAEVAALKKRIRDMAPQRQFKVRFKNGPYLAITGVSSTNGVTTISVIRKS
jgi:predicted RNase H-like nuclease (RuvC/YqgF family)